MMDWQKVFVSRESVNGFSFWTRGILVNRLAECFRTKETSLTDHELFRKPTQILAHF